MAGSETLSCPSGVEEVNSRPQHDEIESFLVDLRNESGQLLQFSMPPYSHGGYEDSDFGLNQHEVTPGGIGMLPQQESGDALQFSTPPYSHGGYTSSYLDLDRQEATTPGDMGMHSQQGTETRLAPLAPNTQLSGLSPLMLYQPLPDEYSESPWRSSHNFHPSQPQNSMVEGSEVLIDPSWMQIPNYAHQSTEFGNVHLREVCSIRLRRQLIVKIDSGAKCNLGS